MSGNLEAALEAIDITSAEGGWGAVIKQAFRAYHGETETKPEEIFHAGAKARYISTSSPSLEVEGIIKEVTGHGTKLQVIFFGLDGYSFNVRQCTLIEPANWTRKRSLYHG